ncbi:hypothetical protein STEG23_000857 [Scotinomys teguina]
MAVRRLGLRCCCCRRRKFANRFTVYEVLCSQWFTAYCTVDKRYTRSLSFFVCKRQIGPCWRQCEDEVRASIQVCTSKVT